MTKAYCNKCNKEFKSLKELNDNEKEELKENNDFVCSECINKEMLEDNSKGNQILLKEIDRIFKRKPLKKRIQLYQELKL